METIVRTGRKNRDLDHQLLPNSVRDLRLKKNFTLKELARQVGVLPHTIAQFELEGTGLGRLKQWRLAEALGTDISTLQKPGKKFAENFRKTLDIIR